MYHKAKSFLPIFLFFLSFGSFSVLPFSNIATAQEEKSPTKPCGSQDRTCLIDEMITLTEKIDNTAWKDQTYREIAKTLAFDGEFDKAVSMIDKIDNPDTRAMTIRGIGMAFSAQNYSLEELNKKFATLHVKAKEILDPPSQNIALTYIAMSQAFAGDDEGAWKTCAEMQNVSLKNKAYGETAEIQAGRGDFKAAKASISSIESLSYQDKAYETVSRILSDKELYDDAVNAAHAIANTYKQAQAIQYMLDKQKPRERLQSQDSSENAQTK